MSPSSITSIVSVVVACVTVIFVILNYSSTHNKDAYAQKEAVLTMGVKLDGLCATCNQISTDIKAQAQRVNELEKEFVIIKRDLETAYIRIDEIKRGDYLPEHIKKGE